MSELPKQYIMAPNGVPSPLLTHMMNKRRNEESKAPCANQCEAQAFKIEARMQQARISELEAMLRKQHEAIKLLREAVRIFQMGFEPDKHGYAIAKNALKDTEGL